jgi:hypothetical protein
MGSGADRALTDAVAAPFLGALVLPFCADSDDDSLALSFPADESLVEHVASLGGPQPDGVPLVEVGDGRDCSLGKGG